ncbi:MAG: GreA/GreB family elongation factor [Bacteroidales bacterium]|nr:GreA/GreB family elongation factor [Bacteroidales bacterium]
MTRNQLKYASNNTWINKSITYPDYNRILGLIQADLGNTGVSPDALHHLFLIVSNSKKFKPTEVPGDVVTMNSEILVRMENKQEKTIKIVYPHDANTPEDISVYQPIGTACLGAMENSVVYYSDATGDHKAYIKKITFQPEKEKLYNL